MQIAASWRGLELLKIFLGSANYFDNQALAPTIERSATGGRAIAAS